MPDMMRKARQAPGSIGLCVLAGLIVLGSPAAAFAQLPDRWVADETEARAALPVSGETTASLSCAAQRWTLDLPVRGEITIDDGLVLMNVDGRPFELAAVMKDGNISMRLPREALEPLKDGLRMQLEFSGTLAETAGSPVFALRGSRAAISSVEDRCTLRDMSAYQAVTFTPFSSYLNIARELRADDIEAFETATASQPKVSVAMIELGAGRRILFARLCGSSWYYGLSGCNITGFVPQADPVAEGDAEGETTWRVVYDTENVALYLDPGSKTDGWPDLVSLPVRGSGPGLVWRWEGRGYALKGELPPDEEDAGTLGLRPTQE